ncbi:MAG TPA: DUF4268 domain-containing protein [Deinococcales bacterium]|nr:DUF4268 domain-containing protein [Deinococcales bacterium]
MVQALGRLEAVDPREVWAGEASDFTPWLATAEGLELLSDTIGLDLELEAQEKNVGPFRADILCKNTVDGSWVLVENQLERTDHNHLGQILTYAAGLDAVTIVWVARRFTDEHRAALDWLNRVTEAKINFFGLELEVWRIGNSARAPKFNIVSQPNDWEKVVGPGPVPDLTPTKQMQFAFWTEFREFLIERQSVVKPQKALPQQWATFSIGRSGFHLEANLHTGSGRVGALLVIEGSPDTKKYFHLLERERQAIEAELGETLDWAELPGKGESRVRLFKHGVSFEDATQRPSVYEWLASRLEALHKVFAQRVKNLDASQWAPDDESSEPVEG